MSRKIELPRVVGSTEALRIRTPTTQATTDLLASDAGRLRFEADVKEIARVIGLADRAVPVANYGIGLMLPCERKSVEPIAALAAPKHQWLLRARGRAEADQVLAINSAGRDRLRGSRCRQPALADRARLPRPQEVGLGHYEGGG